MHGRCSPYMSPDLYFLLVLALRMAITAAFVISASIITERSGPVIGALVATLSLSGGPSCFFLGIAHDAAFVAQGALASLPINAATIVMGTIYVVLAQRHSVTISLPAALVVWLACGLLVRSFDWTFADGILANIVALAICLPVVQRFRAVKMPLIVRR